MNRWKFSHEKSMRNGLFATLLFFAADALALEYRAVTEFPFYPTQYFG